MSQQGGGGSGPQERQFIHDVAGPLGTVMLMLSIILEDLQKNPEENAAEIQQMGLVNVELEKMRALLVDRRKILIAQGVPSLKDVEKTKK